MLNDNNMEKVVKALTSLDYHRWILGILATAFVGGMLLLVTLSVNLTREVRDIAPLREEVSSLQSSIAEQSNGLEELAAATAELGEALAGTDGALISRAAALEELLNASDAALASELAALAATLNETQTLLLELIGQGTTTDP